MTSTQARGPAGYSLPLAPSGEAFWSGAADLRLFNTLDRDFPALVPAEAGTGYVFSYAETLFGGKLP